MGINRQFLAANAYDATMVAAQVLVECRSDQACARGKISKLVNFPGVSGDLSIQANGAAKKTVLKVLREGKFVKME